VHESNFAVPRIATRTPSTRRLLDLRQTHWLICAQDWQGLEVRRGETEVHVAAAGRTGVASGYAEEPDVDD